MPGDSSDYGMFIPTTQVWDVSDIYSMDVKSPEFKELVVRLYQNMNNMALVTNKKDSAIYDTQEFVCGQTFFPDPTLTSSSGTTPTQRQVFRVVVNFGALPDTTTKMVAHGVTLTSGCSFTRIYGASTYPGKQWYVPIPYASSVLADNIEISVDNVNVNITTAADWSAYTTTYVVLEYLKL